MTCASVGTNLRQYFAAQAGPSCCQCEKPALRRVGTKGYCKDHMVAANRHLHKVIEVAKWQEKHGFMKSLDSSIDERKAE